MKEQMEKIDNVLITASIALLAAFVVLYSVELKQNIYFNTSASIAVICVVMSLLFTLYAKYREALRKDIFDSKSKKWKDDLEKDLDKMMDDYYAPQLLQMTKSALRSEENKLALQKDLKSIKDILEKEKSIWEKENKTQNDYARKLFVENQVMKIKNMLDEAFSGPLNEKNAIIKYQIEKLSQKRFTLFVLGLIFFIISVGAKMFI